jgi:lysozyme family protein
MPVADMRRRGAGRAQVRPVRHGREPGVKPAIKALQHAAGQIEDGVLGPHTLLAVQSLPPAKLLFRFDAARLVHYAEMDDARWLKFGRGWVRRVAANMTQAFA